jgi:mannosyltransferase OCH1-like enzyme
MTFAQTKSDFVRIAVLARYGGIYMDVSFFAVENFDWIINISRYPSQYVFNRFGEVPAVFMMFHPHDGQPFNWKLDKEANTKNMRLCGYESSILIAEPNQQLFWEWFDEHGRFISHSYE